MAQEELAREVVKTAQAVWDARRVDDDYPEGPYIEALEHLEALAKEVLGEHLPVRR